MRKLFTLLTAALFASIGIEATTYQLISGGTINTTDFVTTITTLNTASQKFVEADESETTWEKNLTFGSSRSTAWGQSQNIIEYSAKTTKTKVKIYTKADNGSRKVFVQEFVEGHMPTSDPGVDTTYNLGAKNAAEIWTYTTNNDSARTLYFMGNNGGIMIYQIVIEETGTLLPRGGQIGYATLLKNGRHSINGDNKEYNIDGISYSVKSAMKPGNGGKGAVMRGTTNKMKFTISEVVKLTVKEVNKKGYYLTQNSSESYDATKAVTTGTKEFVLRNTGDWYIICNTSSDCQIDSIAFEAYTPSSDATLSEISVGGDALDLSGFVLKAGALVYDYELGYGATKVPAVTYTLNDEYASAVKTDAANVNDTTSIVVTAEDGTTKKTYKISFSVSETANTDATLKALAVEGYTLSPAFAAETTTYSITKAYKAKNPAKSKITATPNDVNAKSVAIDSLANSYTITVTAEDNTTTKVYTINVIEADAPRAIKEIFMSNKYMAYIPDGDATNIYAYYLAGEDAATIDSVNRSEGATWAVNEGKLRVTGEDSKYSDYTLNISSVTPVEYTTNVITFDSTNMNTVNAWVKAPYGFDQKKGGWKFSKTDNDYTREKAGKTHLELFLPACDTLVLKAGSNGTERDAKYYVNGVQIRDTTKLTQAGITLVVKQSAPFMLTIASAQTSGDGGLGSIRMARSIFTVTYDAGEHGTCATETAKVVNGAKVTLPAVTPAEGYHFNGWFTKVSDGTRVGMAGDEITITSDTTLHAICSTTPDFYIAGMGAAEWQPNQIPVYGTSYTFENLEAGSYAFKITTAGTWETGKGFSDLTASEVIAGLYVGENNNVCFTLADAGDVTITYDGEIFKAEGNFEPQVVKIKGGWDEWAWHTLTLSNDKKFASDTLTLEVAENVEFIVLINNDDYRKNGKTFVRNDNSATGITGNGDNMKLTSDKAGDYIFKWIFGTNALEITFPTGTTDFENVVEEGKAVKVIRNGQLFIEKNGHLYNAMGQMIK